MESFMAGCVVAADLPFEMEEMFRDVVIVLDKTLSNHQINRILQQNLRDNAELKRKAAKALVLARKYFSCEQKVERMLDTFDEYQRGVRGYNLPFGIRLGCHSYTYTLTRPNKWCGHALY